MEAPVQAVQSRDSRQLLRGALHPRTMPRPGTGLLAHASHRMFDRHVPGCRQSASDHGCMVTDYMQDYGGGACQAGIGAAASERTMKQYCTLLQGISCAQQHLRAFW